MRVLWITPGFAADEQDLNCIPPLQLLARDLLRAGIDLDILTLEYPFTNQPYSWQPEDSDRAARVYPAGGANRRWLHWRTSARARNFAQKLVTEGPFSAIHSFWLGPAWILGRQFARRYEAPHWTTLMGQDVLPQNRYLNKLRITDTPRLVALSNFHAGTLKTNTGYDIKHIIPWGIPASEQIREFSNHRPNDVLGVGSLIPVKDWARWLKVVQLAARKIPHLQAELVGGGPDEHRLKEMAQQLGISGRVRFTGMLTRPEVLQHMQQGRILLHTSRFESFGYVFVEAAARGCRIISTPVGVAPEIGQCAGHEQELADLLVQALQMQTPAAPPVPFTMQETARQYLRLYGVV